MKQGKGRARKKVKLEQEKEEEEKEEGGRDGNDERKGEDCDAAQVEAEAKERGSRKKRKRRGEKKRKAREEREVREAKKEREAKGEVDCSKGVFIDSFQQNKYTYGPIREGDGVMFVTYSSLVAANRDGKSRLKQVSVCVWRFVFCVCFMYLHATRTTSINLHPKAHMSVY